MNGLKNLIIRKFKKAIRQQKWFQDHFAAGRQIAPFRFEGQDIRKDIEKRYQYEGDLLDIYTKGSPQLVRKWHHYLPIYDRYFSKWRGKKVRFLEIGVSGGGSLAMWRQYFGKEAIIYGIDIDESCIQYDGIAGVVRIGSQDDPFFLTQVVEEMGGVDLILDDGSHIMKHIKTSFEALMPLLENDGTYMIEDLHASYWKGYGGGLRRRGNFFNYVREIIDDMHHWYHGSKSKHSDISVHCNSIHIHDSICVFEKSLAQRPTHSEVKLVEPDAT